MKINDAQLSSAYWEYVSEKMKQPRASCPTAEDIVECLRNESPRKKQKRIVAHIAECTDCLEIARSFLSVMKREKQFEKEIGMVLSEEPRKSSHEKSNAWRELFLKWAIATAIVFGGLFLLYRMILQKPYDDRERGGRTEGIQISQPLKIRINRNDLIIRWEKYGNVNQYVVEIYDKALKSVWRSDINNSIEIKPSMKIVQGLEPNESYFIMVSAILKDGKVISSKMKEFILEK